MTIKVFTDGASRGNPGNAGIGIAVLDEGDNLIASAKEFIGQCTNNYAEYTALIKSLDVIGKLGKKISRILFYCDSELLVKQIKGQYRIKNKDLIKLSLRFQKIINELNIPFEITHVTRDKNKTADKLANEAIDAAVGKKHSKPKIPQK